MTTRPWAWPGVLAAALWLSAPGHAQPTAAEHPLRQGLAAAWARQPEQQAAALRREAHEAAVRAAQRWVADAPSLDVTARTDRAGRNEGGREYDATLAIPLWLPGERSRARSVAQAEAAALGARWGASRWKLAEQVRAAYWEHARAALDLQLASERLSHARLLAGDVARRLKAGDLARADGHQAEGAVAAAEAALAEARVQAGRSARQWLALTGLGPPPVTEAQAEASPTNGEVNASAHPALQELAAKAEVARHHRDLAGTQRYANPELTVGAVRERGAYGERYGQSIVVGVRIPLGTRTGSASRVATAGAEQLEAEVALSLETQRISAEVAASRDEVRARQAAVDAADRRARLARESRGFFEKSFRLGESDLPTRLRVDLEAFEAERQSARARIELSAAISALRQALGLLPE